MAREWHGCMQGLLDKIDSHIQKNILKGIVTVLAVMVLLQIPGVWKEWKYRNQPVRKIECEFVGQVRPTEQVTRGMIRVTAQTPLGERYDVSDKYTVDVTQAPRNGSYFDVQVMYRGVTETLTIPVTRNPVVEYSIGYPNPQNVKATVYSNGDLVFTGEGETQDFSKDRIPWKADAYSYVEFEPGIEAKNIDNWFRGNKDLIECRNIPKTVESMRSTFEDDTGLVKAPDYFQCTSLRIMENTFKGCILLERADILPVNVVNADYLFSGCVSMEKAPDIMKANSLAQADGMFMGCTRLVHAPQLPNSVVTMKNCYSKCINIHKAAAFPVMAENIENCYEGCTSLEEASSIPESVIRYSGCFSGCRDLNGRLEINTDSANYSSVLNGAATAGKKLFLSGNSGYLIAIQHETKNPYVVLENIEESTRQASRLRTELGG